MKNRISLFAGILTILFALAACTPAQPQPTPTPSPMVTPTPATTPSPSPVPSPTAEGNQPGGTGDVTTPKGLEDGVYTGRTEKDERGNYGEIKITIADEKITEVDYVEYTEDGKPKSKENGYEYENALKAFEELPKRLIETQDVDKVDDYSGATGTSNKFRTAAKSALSSKPDNTGSGNGEDTGTDEGTGTGAGGNT